MRFDIDTPRAKTLATRLQAFLADNPKPKLSRSSAIEAVARMLGFNNRNEMMARLDEVPAESVAAPSPEAAVGAALTAFLDAEIAAQAQRLVALGHANLPGGDFSAAMHADSADGHAMLAAEESISTRLDRDGAYRRALAGALRESDEFASCRNERISDNDALAMALVNAALSVAEAMWDEAPGVSGDTADVALWQSRIDAQAAEIDTAIRDGMTAQSEFITRAQTLADEMGEPVGRLVADLRQAFIRLTGQTPEEAEAARDWPERVDEDVSVFGVAVLAWVPATSGVDLPDGRSGEIEADVLCHETLQVEACDEADAMVRARRRLEAEYLYDIWEPCPGRGIRDAHWVGDLADDEALDDPSRVVDLAKEAWVYRYEDASGFVADQVVDKPA